MAVIKTAVMSGVEKIPVEYMAHARTGTDISSVKEEFMMDTKKK